MNTVWALVEAMLSDPTLSAMTAGNFDQGIYDYELPPQMDFAMPAKVIIARPHGGPPSPLTVQLHDQRFSMICYGETPSLAGQVYYALYKFLKLLGPSVWGDTYLHHCNETAGPIPNRDGHEQWPFNISTWLVRASDLTLPVS